MDDKVISKHYGISGILDSILRGLESSGKNLQALTSNDLSPIDEFWIKRQFKTRIQFHPCLHQIYEGLVVKR